LTVPAWAAATLVVAYPYLWVSPIRNTYRMFAFRSDSFEMQAASFPPAAVTSRADAFRRVGHELADRFSAAGQISEWLGIAPNSWVREIDLAVAVLGTLLIVAAAIRIGPLSPHAMALLILGGQTGLILATIGVEYARYLLPVLLAVAVAIGFVVGAAIERTIKLTSA
jgi:hypothetical protein